MRSEVDGIANNSSNLLCTSTYFKSWRVIVILEISYTAYSNTYAYLRFSVAIAAEVGRCRLDNFCGTQRMAFLNSLLAFLLRHFVSTRLHILLSHPSCFSESLRPQILPPFFTHPPNLGDVRVPTMIFSTYQLDDFRVFLYKLYNCSYVNMRCQCILEGRARRSLTANHLKKSDVSYL
jgi:hypothetical protein